MGYDGIQESRMSNKSSWLRVRISDELRLQLEHEAEALGMTLSDLVRERLKSRPSLSMKQLRANVAAVLTALEAQRQGFSVERALEELDLEKIEREVA